MEEIIRLNVRVYGLLLKDNNLLFLREEYASKELFKLPGGGLELGESTVETLKREFFEELDIKIRVLEHIYTQDFVVKSSLTPQDQLLAIYYKVQCDDLSSMQAKESKIKSIEWVPIHNLKRLDGLLPVDKMVIDTYF